MASQPAIFLPKPPLPQSSQGRLKLRVSIAKCQDHPAVPPARGIHPIIRIFPVRLHLPRLASDCGVNNGKPHEIRAADRKAGGDDWIGQMEREEIGDCGRGRDGVDGDIVFGEGRAKTAN